MSFVQRDDLVQDLPATPSHPVWTENSTLAFRRPFSGGAEAAEPANIALVCLGQASESTIGPFISDRPGESGVPNSCACGFISRHWLAYSYCSNNPRATRRGFYGSGSGPVVVVQHATQALPALDLSCVTEVARFWADELVPQALMIALAVIMSDEVLNGGPQRLLAEEDHAIQARLLDATHKSLRVGVQIWRSRW